MDQSFAVVLPLKKKARLEIGDVITELRLLVEQTGATVRMDPRMLNHAGPPARSGMFSLRSQPAELMQFELDGVRMRIAQVSEPFADRQDMGRYVNPVMWEAGLGEFTDHRAHIRVHEAGIEGEEGPDATFDRAAAVTATAAVIARLSDPVGAIWLAARNSLPVARFGAALEQLMDGAAPLDFWLRWNVIPPGEMEDAAPGLITSGLSAFVGHEIVARPSHVETRVMIDHAFELARRLIDDKMTISDNQTIEGEGGTMLRLRLGTRFRNGETPVCEIAPVGDAPARRTGSATRVDPRQPTPDPAALFGAGSSGAGSPEGLPMTAPMTTSVPARIEPGAFGAMLGLPPITHAQGLPPAPSGGLPPVPAVPVAPASGGSDTLKPEAAEPVRQAAGTRMRIRMLPSRGDN